MRTAPATRRLALVLATLGLVLTGLSIPSQAPATVAEQRARLPPAAECDDPIAGVWITHAFHKDEGRWHRNTMVLRRSDAGAADFTCSYENYFWTGTPAESERPPCRHGMLSQRSTSTGVASYDGNELTVRGTELGPVHKICGTADLRWVLATVSGPVDTERREFQSVLTSEFGSYPLIFRRVRCLDQLPASSVGPVPSAQPPTKRWSCDCGTHP